MLLLSLLDHVECLRLAPLRSLLKVTQTALKGGGEVKERSDCLWDRFKVIV